ncbi:class I SAM-dependent methyltransferase [Tenacibaculum sp. nBUS_03]|uniref:class I SAM-dependent methyltransferase n=1 Tax=Tenacibaculum sp. nBUS_03 TaxID=3395320 RepID=UPI003EBE7FA2
MRDITINRRQGHWILAKMGKKVLRPGGKELTLKLIKNLEINTNDDVVEFAPGLGVTASLALKDSPKTYTGIELNEEAASILRKTFIGKDLKIIKGNATNSTLNDNSYSKVYGEAILTMQNDLKKKEIIKEANRILKKGGLYGIHELALQPDTISDEKKSEIQKELAKAIKVNARPLTINEWTDLLEKEGFEIVKTETSPMHLLEPKRMIDDEGFFRMLKIVFNILTHPNERKRILAMRQVFRKNKIYLKAISIVVKKK